MEFLFYFIMNFHFFMNFEFRQRRIWVCSNVGKILLDGMPNLSIQTRNEDPLTTPDKELILQPGTSKVEISKIIKMSIFPWMNIL